MAVGLQLDFLWYEIGTDKFFYSFFSTIAYNLENKVWGSRFPYLMKNLYNGMLQWQDAQKVIEELAKIKSELKEISVDKVVWDFEDLEKSPPWGNNIAATIKDLSNYFVTSDGRDLIDLMQTALQEAISEELDVEVKVL